MKKFLKYFLISTGVIVLGYVFFGGQFRNYIFKKQVLAKHNPLVTGLVFYSCYKETGLKFDEGCDKALDLFIQRSTGWESLINRKININCSDFKDQLDAQTFYEFYGGGYFNAVKKAFPSQETDLLYSQDDVRDGYMILKPEYWNTSKTISVDTLASTISFKKNICKEYYYDPYGLDADMDCNACEHLPGEIFSSDGLFE